MVLRQLRSFSFLIIPLYILACDKAKNSEKAKEPDEVDVPSSQYISSDRDGEWVRIDTGKVYFLSSQKFFQTDNAADAVTYQSGNEEFDVFSNRNRTESIKFLSDNLIRVEQTSEGSSNPIKFHLLRRGIETATAKGQIKLVPALRDSEGINTRIPAALFHV